MKVTIHPSKLSGNIQAPASKSSMQRACAAALLRKGETIIHNPGHSNDDKAAVGIIKALGAEVEHMKEALRVTSHGIHPVEKEINCGESGLSIRMFTPLVALSDKEITISGSGSLVTRPMDFFDEILPKLGVKIKSSNGRLPMLVQGPLLPANIEVDGSLSSQFLTGLLMAYGASPNPSAGGALDPDSFNIVYYYAIEFNKATTLMPDSENPPSEGREALAPKHSFQLLLLKL